MVEVEAELINALKSRLTGGVIKTFYQGEVDQPPRDYAPILMLWINTTNTQAFDTASDRSVFTGRIRVVFNVTDYLKDSGVPSTAGVIVLQAPYAMKELVEARDVANGTYAANSIMGILRSRTVIRGATYTFNNEFTIDYTSLAKFTFPNLVADITFKVTAVPVRRPAS